MGSEVSTEKTNSVIVITPEQAQKDKEDVSKLPDYTQRLIEMKIRRQALKKEIEILMLKFKDSPGDTTIIQSIMPLKYELNRISSEKSFIKIITLPFERRVDITNQLCTLSINKQRERESRKAKKELLGLLDAMMKKKEECDCDKCKADKNVTNTNTKRENITNVHSENKEETPKDNTSS